MKIKKPFRGDILFIFILVTFISIMIYRIFYEEEIKENSIYSIAFTNEIFSSRRANINIGFKYCFENKIYQGIKSTDSDPSQYLNKFYQIKISDKDPEKYLIDLNQEETDSLTIKKSCIWTKIKPEMK